MTSDHVLRTWPYDPVGLVAWSAAMLQAPVLAGIAWWDILRAAQAADQGHGGSDRHDLVVPPPIEKEGEHALFA